MEQREGTKRAEAYVEGLLLALDTACVKTEPNGSTVWNVYIFDQSGILHSEPVRYTMGSAYAGKLPQLVDVLHSLVMDAALVWHGQTFEDFCSETGLDTDSRKFFKIWEMACFAGFLAGREAARHMTQQALFFSRDLTRAING